MKTKKQYIPFLALAMILITFSSCKKDEKSVPVPVIQLTEVGSGNSKTALVGGDLHIEGHLSADGLIQKIEIEIHGEDGNHYEFGKTYLDGKYIGLKSVEFHEHLHIPSDAPAGEYHLHFTVTDQLGNSAMAESALKLLPSASGN